MMFGEWSDLVLSKLAQSLVHNQEEAAEPQITQRGFTSFSRNQSSLHRSA